MDHDDDTTEDGDFEDRLSDDGTQLANESRQPLVPYNHQQQTQQTQQTQETQETQPIRGKRDKLENTSIMWDNGLGKTIISQGREIITQLGWAQQARIFGPGINWIAAYATDKSSTALMNVLEWAILAMKTIEDRINVQYIFECLAYIKAINYVLILLTILVKKFPRNMSQRLCDLNDKLKCIILKVSENATEASKVPELIQNFQDLQNALRQNISCNLGAGEGVCKNRKDDIPLSTQIKELSDDLRIPLGESIDATGNELTLLQGEAEKERLLLDDYNRMRDEAERERIRMNNADRKSLRRKTFQEWRQEDKNSPEEAEEEKKRPEEPDSEEPSRKLLRSSGGKHKSRKHNSRKHKSRKHKSRKQK